MDDSILYFSIIIIALVLVSMFISLKKIIENNYTIINYMTNMNLYKDYSKELENINILLEEKRTKMGNLCYIINASKNILEEIQQKKDAVSLQEELRSLAKDSENYKIADEHYKKCVEELRNLTTNAEEQKKIRDNAEKKYKKTLEELRNLGNHSLYFIDPKVRHYRSKVKEITKEMNIKGIWKKHLCSA